MLARKSLPFEDASHRQNKPYGRGCYYYVEKLGTRAQFNNYSRFQSPFQSFQIAEGNSPTHDK